MIRLSNRRINRYRLMSMINSGGDVLKTGKQGNKIVTRVSFT